jgi:hypothetical protein
LRRRKVRADRRLFEANAFLGVAVTRQSRGLFIGIGNPRSEKNYIQRRLQLRIVLQEQSAQRLRGRKDAKRPHDAVRRSKGSDEPLWILHGLKARIF